MRCFAILSLILSLAVAAALASGASTSSHGLYVLPHLGSHSVAYIPRLCRVRRSPLTEAEINAIKDVAERGQGSNAISKGIVEAGSQGTKPKKFLAALDKAKKVDSLNASINAVKGQILGADESDLKVVRAAAKKGNPKAVEALNEAVMYQNGGAGPKVLSKEAKTIMSKAKGGVLPYKAKVPRK